MEEFDQSSSKKKIVFIKEYLNEIIRNIKPKKIMPSKENNKIEAIDKKNKDQIDTKKLLKKRNAGIDLIRIITMFGIVYAHLLFAGNVIPKYNRYKKKLIKLFTYFFYNNNGFALISGVIGYKSIKYSNLLYLWLYVVFYSVGIRYYYLKCKQGARINGALYADYYPVIYNRYWYFSSYFGMFIFLPAVNKGLQYLSKPEFKLLVMSILCIFVFWVNYINFRIDVFKLNGGKSPIWLLCLYIVGVYIGRFNLVYTGIKRYIIILIYLFIYLFLSFIYNKYIDYTIININGNYKTILRNFIKKLMNASFNGFIRTMQAIIIILFFLQLKYNKYLSKFITFFGPLTFGVYLIHDNVNVRNNYIKTIFIRESNSLTFNEVIKMIFFKSKKLFLECIIIEYLRHLLFTILKIRKICILIEKIVFKIFS